MHRYPVLWNIFWTWNPMSYTALVGKQRRNKHLYHILSTFNFNMWKSKSRLNVCPIFIYTYSFFLLFFLEMLCVYLLWPCNSVAFSTASGQNYYNQTHWGSWLGIPLIHYLRVKGQHLCHLNKLTPSKFNQHNWVCHYDKYFYYNWAFFLLLPQNYNINIPAAPALLPCLVE